MKDPQQRLIVSAVHQQGARYLVVLLRNVFDGPRRHQLDCGGQSLKRCVQHFARRRFSRRGGATNADFLFLHTKMLLLTFKKRKNAL